MSPANDNGLGDALENGVRHSFANLLRVIRGAGKPNRILADLEGLAEVTVESRGDFTLREATLKSVTNGLLSWHPDEDLSGFRAAEHTICEAALRLVAAKLDRNQMQEGRASIDLWQTVNQVWQDRDDERNARRDAEVQSFIDASLSMSQSIVAASEATDNIMALSPLSECYVYFVTDGEAIKIGKANNPKSRLSRLQTSHHKPLSILAVTPGDEEAERKLHRIFQAKRLRGEWFKDCPEIRKVVDDINAGRYVPTLEAAA